MKKHFKRLLAFRRIGLISGYTACFTLALWLSYQVRFDFHVPTVYGNQFASILTWLLPLKLLTFLALGQFSGKLTTFSTPDFRRLLSAIAASSLLVLLPHLLHASAPLPSRGVAVIDSILTLVIVGGLRLSLRLAWERLREPNIRRTKQPRRVGIVGAGDVGGNLARELLAKRHLGMEPVVFFDDDRNHWRSRVHGILVLGSPELLLSLTVPDNVQPGSKILKSLKMLFRGRPLDLRLDEVIIAMPSAPARRISEVVQILQKAHLKFRTLPSVDQLATGAVNVSLLRKVEIQDLLGRDPVKINAENIHSVLCGKVVMVTGAGGSIGSELCRQIVGFGPRMLLLVEQSEVQMFQIEQDLVARGHANLIHPCIANVLDSERMNHIFKAWQPQVVFHAAAHKHVPMMESHPGEAIKNNTLGTASVAQLCTRYNAERFVLISTDKAINPTNVMGATKRLAEMFIQALHASAKARTKLMGVRFGNVLGSSGSVIPTFARQIAAGGPVKVTHPDITRYFMTIPEAVSLVLQSCAQGEGGEIFVLDMGKPVRIVDLARQMITLSGLTPDVDMEIEFVGLRPGEKLYEELSTKGENICPTLHPKIMRFVSELPRLDQLRQILSELQNNLHCASANELKLQLQSAIPEYRPYLEAPAKARESRPVLESIRSEALSEVAMPFA